tara:strand:- start:202 stop:483 length:282 start_codon:yes stop_codon:yes gene_type:complete
MIVKSFRNTRVPWHIEYKKDLIAWALVRFRDEEPISNGEFVYELRCTRFGGLLHDLRKEGYDIATVRAKQKGHYIYYLLSMPDEETSSNLKLV